jgi:hypothetical protein
MLRVPRASARPAVKENPNQLARLYVEWHWGTKPTGIQRIDDPRLPTHLVECGRLVQLELEVPDSAAARGYSVQKLTIPPESQKSNHLVFDPDHPYHRLYIILDARTRREVQNLFRQSPYAATPLPFWAKLAGGRHATGGYPKIDVKPLGIVHTQGYSTEKLPDGPSWYKHLAGEETGIRPVLCAAADGTLWFAGGDYTSPTPGITN